MWVAGLFLIRHWVRVPNVYKPFRRWRWRVNYTAVYDGRDATPGKR